MVLQGCFKTALEGTALNIRGSILGEWVSTGALLRGWGSAGVLLIQPQGSSIEHRRVSFGRVDFQRVSFVRGGFCEGGFKNDLEATA